MATHRDPRTSESTPTSSMKLMCISIASNSTLHNTKLQIQVRPNDYLTEPCTQALIDLVKVLKSIYEGAENLYGA
jgi:hypothetical protein